MIGTDQQTQDMGHEVGKAVVRTLPPFAVLSFSLNDWLVALSIIYVVLQIAHLAWKWRMEMRKRQA